MLFSFTVPCRISSLLERNLSIFFLVHINVFILNPHILQAFAIWPTSLCFSTPDTRYHPIPFGSIQTNSAKIVSVRNSISTILWKATPIPATAILDELRTSLDLQIRPQDWVYFHVFCGYPPDEKHESRILRIFQPPQVSWTAKMEFYSPSLFNSLVCCNSSSDKMF